MSPDNIHDGSDGKRRIGRYEIVGTLGAGGMGVVYRARDPMIGRDVAIKIVAEQVWLLPDSRREYTCSTSNPKAISRTESWS